MEVHYVRFNILYKIFLEKTAHLPQLGRESNQRRLCQGQQLKTVSTPAVLSSTIPLVWPVALLLMVSGRIPFHRIHGHRPLGLQMMLLRSSWLSLMNRAMKEAAQKTFRFHYLHNEIYAINSLKSNKIMWLHLMLKHDWFSFLAVTTIPNDINISLLHVILAVWSNNVAGEDGQALAIQFILQFYVSCKVICYTKYNKHKLMHLLTMVISNGLSVSVVGFCRDFLASTNKLLGTCGFFYILLFLYFFSAFIIASKMKDWIDDSNSFKKDLELM